MKPLAVDLCCGLGGWSTGLLAEGWDVVGFDVERHEYGTHRYPAQLVLQDILTLDGRQFRGKVSLIVASPPCQKYSYMAMPWTRAKQLASWYRDEAHPERIVDLNALFDACLRIAREAECPIVIENVRGAQPWVGRARWMYGSFALWGDVPALMPITKKHVEVPMPPGGDSLRVGFQQTAKLQMTAEKRLRKEGRKASPGGKDGWFGDYQTMKDGIKQHGSGREWFAGDGKISRLTSSGSSARKAASAHIAKIPLTLARWIARMWYPIEATS